jgi:glycosyltransferase involved in cell wall biosynthesis
MIFLDGERFIDEAIRSVIDQSFTDWELLLVDDGSSDGSTDLALRWSEKDDRIRYVEHPAHANLGMSASRNAGLSHATAPLLAFLDCDDVWLPEHLATHVAVLDADPTLDASYGAFRLWHSWTGLPEDAAFDRVARLGVAPGSVHEPGELLAVYRSDTGSLPGICCVVTRTDAVRRLGGFADEFRGCFEDQVYLAKLGLHLRVHVSGECTSLYRRHEESCCAVAISEGRYHYTKPNEAEHAYLRWLSRYLRQQGATSGAAWTHVAKRLAVYRNPFSAPRRKAFLERARLAARYRRRQAFALMHRT